MRNERLTPVAIENYVTARRDGTPASEGGIAVGDRNGIKVNSSEFVEMSGLLLIDLMRQRNLSNVEVSNAVGIERAHLSKIRRGQRPISAQTVSALATYLEVDLVRLVMAVCVMRRPDLYFDAKFRNAVYVVEYILHAAMDLPSSDGSAPSLSSLSKEGCESYAAQIVAGLREKFGDIDPGSDGIAGVG
jgi:transcriptional regulator with XRE-family HTH domain